MAAATSQATDDALHAVPLYTYWDVARYLRVPAWAAMLVSGSTRGWPHPELLFGMVFRRGMHPRINDGLLRHPELPDSGQRLTFVQAAALFVLSAGFRHIEEHAERDDIGRDRLDELSFRVWRAVESGGGLLASGGLESALDRLAANISLADEAPFLRKRLAIYANRIEMRDGVPSRLYPFSRDPVEGCPRIVAMDPGVRFGRPVLAGRGLPTDILYERHQAGDGIGVLAEDYGLTSAEVEEAIRYEGAPSAWPLIPFAW